MNEFILNQIKDGKIDLEEGLKILHQENSKNKKTIRVNIQTKNKDLIDFKLPITLFNKTIKKVSGKSIKVNGISLNSLLEGIDLEHLLDNFELYGDLFQIQRENGDIIKFYIE